MAHRQEAPYVPQDVHEISIMIQGLESHQKKGRGKGGFSVRKNTFTAPNGRPVDSWKMQDWDYKKPNLPTYARGLFTYQNDQGQPEIAVRGYDKFFNHGEVKKTEWKTVEQNTRGPYELSVKENGCIIFMAGLDDGTLLVCSKHSTGTRQDTDVSHAQAGERWVEKHLASVGKSKQDLAIQLRRMNATAVAELCDDAFEEHVLAYNPETAGLYLHGINLNLPEFVTYPGHVVDRFAADWGFKKTMYVMEDDIGQVKSFLDEIAETGAYNGRETEGFVIRCQAKDTEGAPFEDWFFKYKFDEPYLMYRQWRECTKAVIAGREPKIKKHKKVTEEYLLYARKRFHQNVSLMKAYNQNHGIIKLRDDFLAERGMKGSDIIRLALGTSEHGSDVTKDVVLLPVATIGCGKTTVALALVKLFDWGHVQNDNIQGKGSRPPRFAQACTTAMAAHPVLIADRNNHQKREREQIIGDISKVIPNAKFVALQYVHDRSNYDQIRKATQNRVLSRGDNHQTIQAGSKDPQEIIGIMEGFLDRFQPVDVEKPPDDSFDVVIDLDITSDSRENLETVIEKLNQEYPKLFGRMPSGDDLDNAIEAALNDYKPDIKHDLSRGGNQNRNQQPQGRKQQDQNWRQQSGKTNVQPAAPRQPKLEFFALRLAPPRVDAILSALFRDDDPETTHFYHQLQQSRRVQPEFHVTLIHKASASQYPQVWESLTNLYRTVAERKKSQGHHDDEPELGKCKVQLERVVWDSRIMAFVVRLLDEGTEVNGQANGEGEKIKFETVNKVAHVTVGTTDQSVKPRESNDLLGRWLESGSGGETGMKELVVRGNVVLNGSVRGVLSRF